ncbi:GNAT family N-acetyltransferase [Paenibacillus sp. 5J-6]|uniref:GNAT family N-acetyltransferase n=1 Tax=Paenibacillus silvestris TaxID=2606219 RepID=A0A6L8V8Y8_9BACL|nr:GNAT family N-acetyltransferase [Paenibacillus silvestris]MZQ86747.1 GNAT family N-acetyltransferase [Paenibacillus silvestris]
MAIIRLAAVDDVEQLVQLRWDFTAEDQDLNAVNLEEFYETCSGFLVRAIESGDWYIWIAEIDSKIVSHMYLQLIHKIPRPGKSPDPYYGYVTNVYTQPPYRSQGLGTSIQQAMETWSKENKVEFLIVWPSSHSVDFYLRNGFMPCEEAMEKHW